MEKKLLFTVVVLLFLAYLRFAEPPNDASNSIPVGVLLCLQGVCSEWGENALKGAMLAAEEINSAGGLNGKQIELIVEDSAEGVSVGRTISAFRSLKNKGTRFLIGPSWTPAGLALAPIVSKDKDIIMMSPSLGVASFNETAKNLFTLWPHDSHTTEKIARHMYQLGIRRVAIFSSEQPWDQLQGRTFEKEFVRLGGTVTIRLEPNPGKQDIKVEATKVVASRPEAVFLSNFQQLAIALKEMRKLKFKGVRATILIDETRIKNAEGAMSGVWYAKFPEAKEEFTEAFRLRFGDVPGPSAATAYDAIYAFAKAYSKNPVVDISLAKQLLEQRTLGASGEIVFDTKGGLVRVPQILKYGE